MVCCSSGGVVVGTAAVAACAGAVTVAVTAAVPVVLPLVCGALLWSPQSPEPPSERAQSSANFPVSCFAAIRRRFFSFVCGFVFMFTYFILYTLYRLFQYNTQSFYTQVPTACCPHTRTRTFRGLRGSPTSVASVSFSISVSVSNSSGFGSESDSDSG
jgi:hypothetical protein